MTETRRLGQTDITITPIGLGCWQFSQAKGITGRFWAALDQPTMNGVVATSLAGGINWFDTAQAYGNGRSERALSTALRHAHVEPGEVVVATKWMPLLKRASDIPRTIDERVACLQGYPIDLYQVHQPWSVSSIAAQMHEMAKLVHAGRVRAVGVSNFSARQMTEASRALQADGLVLASNQVRISLLDRRVERNGVLDAANALGVTLIAYSPLGQGLLTGKFHEHPELADSLPRLRKTRLNPSSRAYTLEHLASTRPLIEALRTIAQAHGATASQVALAWLITRYGPTVVAIPGASRAAQAADNAAAMDLRLMPDEITRLIDISGRVAQR